MEFDVSLNDRFNYVSPDVLYTIEWDLLHPKKVTARRVEDYLNAKFL